MTEMRAGQKKSEGVDINSILYYLQPQKAKSIKQKSQLHKPLLYSEKSGAILFCGVYEHGE